MKFVSHQALSLAHLPAASSVLISIRLLAWHAFNSSVLWRVLCRRLPIVFQCFVFSLNVGKLHCFFVLFCFVLSSLLWPQCLKYETVFLTPWRDTTHNLQYPFTGGAWTVEEKKCFHGGTMQLLCASQHISILTPSSVTSSRQPNFFCCFKFIYLLILRWKRAGEGQRENPKQASRCQHRTRWGVPGTVRLWPEPKPRVRGLTNWGAQVPPGNPVFKQSCLSHILFDVKI